MDNITENNDNSSFYKYSEKGVKSRDFELWSKINDQINFKISFKEKFYLYENKIQEPPKCYCGKSLKFLDMRRGYREFCNKNCMSNSEAIKMRRKDSSIKKWGVDNPSKSSEIKDKVKKTNNERFGVDYPLQSSTIFEKYKSIFFQKWGADNPSKIKEIREKANKTIKKNWGVDHIMFSDQIKEKTRKYFIEKWGVDNPSKNQKVREKAIMTMISKWGVDSALKSPILLDKFKKTNLKKWGEEFYTKTEDYKQKINKIIFDKNSLVVNSEKLKLIHSKSDEFLINCSICGSSFKIQRQLWRVRVKNNEDVCLNCNPVNNSISREEKIILDFIRDNYEGKIIENYKESRKEIDIYLPELNIGFEFNGLYWHSELQKVKMYHYDKYKFFKEKGIDIISIWEDDWEMKKDIVKSIIINRLGKTPEKIFARKCEIKELYDNKIIRNFLDNNHIQGFIGSKVKLGLFYNDELVSLMTFGELRKSLGQSSKEGDWELFRFCTKLNTRVIGAGSKLFNYFLKNYKPDRVISYSLNSYSTGNLYEKLGFTQISETKSNYFWSKNKKRYHRFNFRKDKLIKDGHDPNLTEKQIMYQIGYFRVFDCGSKKYLFEK